MLIDCLVSALFFILSLHIQVGQGAGSLIPFKRTDELIADDGYIAEEFKVKTADGYVLTIFRIPYGLDGPSMEYRPAILLMPGTSFTSDQWIMVENCSLANEGYDVWLGNYRGSTYGQENLYYSIKSKEFWEFSFHESGVYDLPAIIDFILKQTGQSDLIYLGFSKGTTCFCVLLSLFPEYNEKISLGVMYAPVLAGKGTLSVPFHWAMAMYKTETTEKIFNRLGIYNLFVLNDFLKLRRFLTCNQHSITKHMCWSILSYVCGTDPATERNITHSGKFFSHLPDGTSFRDLFHFIQTGQSGRFAQYDYGSKNMEIYGSLTPPRYRTENIRVPLFVAHADNDAPSSKKVYNSFLRCLKTSYVAYRVPYDSFSHANYVLNTAPELLYIPTLNYIKEFSSRHRVKVPTVSQFSFSSPYYRLYSTQWETFNTNGLLGTSANFGPLNIGLYN